MGRRWWRQLTDDVFGVLLVLVGCPLAGAALLDSRDAVVRLVVGSALAKSSRALRITAGQRKAIIENGTSARRS